MELINQNKYKSFTKLYVELVNELLNFPQYTTSPRGVVTHENTNVILSNINPRDCHIDFLSTGLPERQEVYDKYCKAELEWYLSGNTLASSAPSKFWNTLANKDGHITSNYGDMMLFDELYPNSDPELYSIYTNGHSTAFDRVVKTLTNDTNSRQAIVHYNQPKHCYPENKDFPCTMSSQFLLRDVYLTMTTTQRSCDVIKGLSYDIPWNCYFLELVAEKLKQNGVEIKGTIFNHVIGSLHLYKKDFELAKKIVTQMEREL